MNTPLEETTIPVPLRIAYLVWQFPSISETFTINEVCGALERGHDVTILALGRPSGPAAAHPDIERFGACDHLLRLALPEGIARVPAILELAWRRRRALPRVVRLLDGRRFGWAGFKVKLLYQGLELASLPPFDIVHCQFGTLGLIGWRARACGLLRGRIVTTFRGDDVSRFVREHGPAVYTGLFADGEHFLTNCNFFRDRLISLGCDPRRLSVQRSGVDLSRFAFTPRSAPEKGPIVIATVGRLVEKKGIADGLEAIAQVARTHPRVVYRILGDGPLRGKLAELAARLGMSDRVTFLGAGAQQKVIDTLSEAHLFLAPSVTAASGDQDAPINSLKEAMAMGLPVISTMHGGIPELVVDGVSGRLTPERDPAALARAICDLIRRADHWPRLGAAGRAKVEAEYNRDCLNDQLDALYRRIAVESRSVGAPINAVATAYID